MEEGKDFNVDSNSVNREEVFSKVVRAGKRTYFFDVKATRKNEYYLTITESKKRYNKDGRFFYEKHKIFLYKEDFEKFQDGLSEVLGFIEKSNSNLSFVEDNEQSEMIGDIEEKKYTDVSFDDLEEITVAQEAEENN